VPAAALGPSCHAAQGVSCDGVGAVDGGRQVPRLPVGVADVVERGGERPVCCPALLTGRRRVGR